MKEKAIYVCSECGYQSVRWLGRCPECGKWNTFIEEVNLKTKVSKGEVVHPKKISEIKTEKKPRVKTKIGEFDRVLGGGVVVGSFILIAGHPGVGKSTLLLTISGIISKEGKKVLYISGEESESQIKLRCERLKINSDNLFLLASPDIDSIKNALEKLKPEFLIVDSIQTVYNSEIPTTPGSVTQVKENANFLFNYTKKENISTFIIGHITKEGAIAGPKLLEHMVDVVIYFEGETKSNLRILRAIKNRFGPTDEIGVFSMEENGLKEIPDASAIFLPEFRKTLPGAVFFPSQEGKRTIIVEIQSLITPTYYGIPKRAVTGLDYNRVSLVLAVLEKKLNFNFSTYDVFVNVGGGFKITETASDLPVAISCVSSLKDIPPCEDTVFIGEIALTGEIRPVSQINSRIKECARLGFKKAIIPEGNIKESKVSKEMEIIGVKWLKDCISIALSL